MKKSALFLMFFGTVMFTQNAKAETLKKTLQTTIAYAGVKENKIVFEITWSDAEGATEILIKDKSGNLVYKEICKEAKLKKRFLLSKEESEQYTFILINGKKRTEKTFQISTSFVENTNVNELK